MDTTAKSFRWVCVLALAAAQFGAHAQALDDASLVWIDNQTFGFEACAALGDQRAAEDAGTTLSALRGSAAGQLGDAVRLADVALGSLQHLTMTPVDGRFACGASVSEVTFRIAAVDRMSGKFWSADLKLRADESTADRSELASLGDDLALAFRGVVTQSAMLR